MFLLFFCCAMFSMAYSQENYEVVFRIQLGISTKMPDEHSIFRKHYTDIEGVELEDGKIRVYTGKYETYNEALEGLDDAQAKGYKYAVVVGFHNGKRVSVDKALNIIYGD